MSHKLILASAGAGKSQLIINSSMKASAEEKKTLILTYTENNQKELFYKICAINNYCSSNIVIKGWFTFLLEDIIRPYQSCIFKNRIPGIFFNQSDPHKRNGQTIPGRSEKTRNGGYNSLYYLTRNENRAHTTFISKLASRVCKEAKRKPIGRISEIYDSVLIDEVQDLVGWDFDVIGNLANSDNLSLICVGDFRQTIYTTHTGTKQPKTNAQKLEKFKSFGFVPEHLNISWRCIQSICDFGDLVHNSENIYLKTVSQIDQIPEEYIAHNGVFMLSLTNALTYLNTFKPVILRATKNSQKNLCKGYRAINFGASKGLGFDRILIVTTEKQKQFLRGNHNIFDGGKTDKAKNAFYVAITRARFSVAFLYDGDNNFQGIPEWIP
ncbi:UvrD-helicase domain-containing protein [Aquimarina macrocephali]|uniref:UvrD-helicase domain-containing protein n=1 Tax=Aquimarina macrocephali TaxID=666563 RepID=UPI0004638F66|nr:UvrD-helicase domain-containing protein [Aquimarina macrocephali]